MDGGVVLAINIKYNCIRIPTESIAGIDFIFTLLNYNNCKLLLSCVYIPPNTHNYSHTAYCELVEKIISSHFITNILIIGDFNIPGFMWSINEPSANNIVNLVANSFINYLDLKECYNIANHRQDILDLIFSDSQINNISKSLSLTPIFDAYHRSLELIYPLTTSPVTLVESLTPIMYNFNSCNFDEMCTFLSEFDFIYNLKKYEQLHLNFMKL